MKHRGMTDSKERGAPEIVNGNFFSNRLYKDFLKQIIRQKLNLPTYDISAVQIDQIYKHLFHMPQLALNVI